MKSMTMEEKRILPSAAGAPVPDNDKAITAVSRSPVLLQDVW